MNQISHNTAFLELHKELGGKGTFWALALGLDFSQVAEDLGYLAGVKEVCSCSRPSQGLCHSSDLISSPFKDWAAISFWKLSSFTAFHRVLVGRKILSTLPLSVRHASFCFWGSFCYALVEYLSIMSNKIVSIHEGLDNRIYGVELPFMLGFLVADFTDFCFPFAVESSWVCAPRCRWSSTFEKKVYGMLSHANFLSVLSSSILIYFISTLESSGMQTHVRSSSWESTELHLHLLAVVRGHTTVWITLALDKANSNMDNKSCHSTYHAPLVQFPFHWPEVIHCFGSLHYIEISLYLSRCSWNISQKKRSYLQTGLM